MDYASLVENLTFYLLSVVSLVLSLETAKNRHCFARCLDMVNWENHGNKDCYFTDNCAVYDVSFCDEYFNYSFVLGFVDSMDIKHFQPN